MGETCRHSGATTPQIPWTPRSTGTHSLWHIAPNADGMAQAIQENLDLALESYRAGKIDFLQLLLVRRQTLDAQGEHIDVLAELNAA